MNLIHVPYVRSRRGARGPSTLRLEQPHKQERHHTLTQNLKAMGLWVLLLIRCSTFTLLSDVGHITHTCTQQHSPSSVSPSIHHATPQAKALTLHVSLLLVSPQTDWDCLYRRCCFLRKRTGCLSRTLCQTGLWYHCWDTEGSSGDHPHRG